MKTRRTRSKNAPFWLTARYSGKCSCGSNIKPGQQIYWYPNGRKAVCRPCGRNAELRIMEEDLKAILLAK